MMFNVGRKVRDFWEKSKGGPEGIHFEAMMDFDITLRNLLAREPVPVQFLDDELIIRVEPAPVNGVFQFPDDVFPMIQEDKEEDKIKYLVDVRRKCGDYLEKRESDDAVVKVMIEFDDALRRLLKVECVPDDRVIRFLDDELVIRVKPIPEEDKNKT
jgi:hypothetical protein